MYVSPSPSLLEALPPMEYPIPFMFHRHLRVTPVMVFFAGCTDGAHRRVRSCVAPDNGRVRRYGSTEGWTGRGRYGRGYGRHGWYGRNGWYDVDGMPWWTSYREESRLDGISLRESRRRTVTSLDRPLWWSGRARTTEETLWPKRGHFTNCRGLVGLYNIIYSCDWPRGKGGLCLWNGHLRFSWTHPFLHVGTHYKSDSHFVAPLTRLNYWGLSTVFAYAIMLHYLFALFPHYHFVL